jgi:hypothetical protein
MAKGMMNRALALIGLTTAAMDPETTKRMAAHQHNAAEPMLRYVGGVPFYPGRCTRKRKTNMNHVSRRARMKHKMRKKYNY